MCACECFAPHCALLVRSEVVEHVGVEVQSTCISHNRGFVRHRTVYGEIDGGGWFLLPERVHNNSSTYSAVRNRLGGGRLQNLVSERAIGPIFCVWQGRFRGIVGSAEYMLRSQTCLHFVRIVT